MMTLHPAGFTHGPHPKALERMLVQPRTIADDDMKVVFVRGAGPAFCAGADIKERAGKTREWVRERRLKAFAAYRALESLPMPVNQTWLPFGSSSWIVWPPSPGSNRSTTSW